MLAKGLAEASSEPCENLAGTQHLAAFLGVDLWVLTLVSQLVLVEAPDLAVLVHLARSVAQGVPGPAAHAPVAREAASLPMD